jgi:molybdopterin-guanine dinucleotide biosynthesis protein A
MLSFFIVSRAGYVLVGGKSSRMGRDKALLPFRGGILAGQVAAVVARAAGSVALIGDPQKYGHLGYQVLPDRCPGAGPAGGIESALSYTTADWNLVLACDMPAMKTEFLHGLMEAAERLGVDALIPAGPSGRPEPLCAVYHRRCGAVLRLALEAGVRKVTRALDGLNVLTWTVDDAGWFENLNTPEEWSAYQHDAR